MTSGARIGDRVQTSMAAAGGATAETRRGTARSLTRRTWLTAVSFVANYGVTLLVGFFASPLLLTLLGSSSFGTWKVCQRLLTYISGVDGQATQALQWTIAHKQGDGGRAEKRRDVGCAVTIWLKFLPLLILVGATVAWLAPGLIRGLPETDFTATRIACAVLVLNLVFLPISSIPEAVMAGMNLSYKCTWVRAGGALLGGLLMVAAAYAGWGLIGLALAVLVASLLSGLLVLVTARRNLPWLGVARPQPREVRSFFGFSAWVLTSALVSKFMLASDVLILGLVVSATAVSSYVLSSYTVQMTMSLVLLLVSAGLPGLGGIVGAAEFARAGRVRGELMLFSWLATAVAGTLILLWNGTFVTLWVGAENFVGQGVNLLLVLLMTQLIFIRNDARILDVTLDIRSKVLLGLLSAVVSVFCAWLLANRVWPGVAGVAAGLMVGRALISCTYPLLVRRAFRAAADIPVRLLRPAAVTLALYAAGYWLGPRLTVPGWAQLIVWGCGSLPPLVLLSFYLGLNFQQRRQLLQRLAQLGLSWPGGARRSGAGKGGEG